MEDLDETVRTAVNIVSASLVGHHVKNQAAFDVLLQTLVDISILNQENIRSPAVLPFCGPKGLDRFSLMLGATAQRRFLHQGPTLAGDITYLPYAGVLKRARLLSLRPDGLAEVLLPKPSSRIS
ncbi:hypothetical protein AXF42_Ash014235 [Apostasia shenzhenica]|uniref:Uncharacterized protein n=1 Tax=Apostasia shenzhenica TaxID=1088818 RepID=A0A2I0A1A9_9ASPA|nr:hypothetical protein AXF42_Ash014235 [Apostasia shenzhenica]